MANRILLVEDSVTMQKVVKMTFSAEDFDLTLVSSGEEALEVLGDTEGGYREAPKPPPDIVITDLSLAGMSGYEVCKSIKQKMGLPVLLLHGSAAPYDENKARAVGADGEIAKPFETQALIDKVKALTAAGVRPAEIDLEAAAEVSAETPPPPRPKRHTAPPPLPTRPKRVTKGPPPPPPPRRPRTTPPPPPRPARETPPLGGGPPPIMEAPTVAMEVPVAELAESAMPTEQEIVIEAELPPPSSGEPLPSFEIPTQDRMAPPLEVAYPRDAPADTVTLKGFSAPDDLPEPPDGLGTPPALPRTRPAVPAVAPEAYAAIAKLSKEIIERVVWEVVPQLAEKIIREELDRLVEKPRSR